jgi:multidrug resistance efflux pump
MARVGLLALAVSFAVAAVAPYWARADKPVPSAKDAAASAKDAVRGLMKAVCFGYVDVEQGLTSLYPTLPGRVVEVFKKEGEEVEAGTPLFRVDDALAQLRLREAKVALAAAEAQLAQARTLPVQHQKQIEAKKAQVEAARQDVEAARAQHDKAHRFFEKNLASAEEDRAAEALLHKAEAGLRGHEADLAALSATDPKVAVTLAEQNVAAKRVDVEKGELAVRECTVSAPTKGSIMRLSVGQGEVLGPMPRQPALLFCSKAPRIVRAEVEQEFAEHVAVGQAAAIQDDATSTGSWTGKVVRLSDWYAHRRSILLEPMQYNDVRTLECIIELAPNQPPLRIGQRVRVTLGSVEP